MSKAFQYHPSYPENALIFRIVEAARGFNGLSDANLYFGELCNSQPGFTRLAGNVYQYKDYYIQVGKRFLMAGHGNCLMGLNRLELSCLPRGIALVWLDNDEDMVLVTQIPGSEGQRMVPCQNGPLSEQARKRLLQDVDRLMAENLTLLPVTEDRRAWHLLEEEERIIFSRCQTAFLPENAKPAYRKRVLNALDLCE